MTDSTQSTLLCLHREPAQLDLLRENGYRLVTATNGGDGLRLFMSWPVDGIVLDYHLGLLDGAVVAAEVKQVKPQVPIVMLADNLDLPYGALKSVDAIVAKSDGPHFLGAPRSPRSSLRIRCNGNDCLRRPTEAWREEWLRSLKSQGLSHGCVNTAIFVG
jgi:CheY-like chemotaxis protein